jgi:hypothetical protein
MIDTYEDIAEWSNRCPAVKSYKAHKTHWIDENGREHFTQEGDDWEKLISLRAMAESKVNPHEAATSRDKYIKHLDEVQQKYGYIHPRVILRYPDLGTIDFKRRRMTRPQGTNPEMLPVDQLRKKRGPYGPRKNKTAPKRPSMIKELMVDGQRVGFREWLLNYLTYASVFGPGATADEITSLTGAFPHSFRSAMNYFRETFDCFDPEAEPDRLTRRISVLHPIPGKKVPVYRMNQVPTSRRLTHQPAIPEENFAVMDAEPQQRHCKLMVPCDKTGKVIAIDDWPATTQNGMPIACEHNLDTVALKPKECEQCIEKCIYKMCKRVSS